MCRKGARMSRVIVFAPNVGVGGGLVLLRAFLKAWPSDRPTIAILDQRGRDALALEDAGFPVHWVRSSVSGRWQAERLLATLAGEGDTIFCFHNLPPVLASRGQVVCYVHNAHLVGMVPASQLGGWVRVRCTIERAIARWFGGKVDRYLVQTPSMAAALAQTYGLQLAAVDVLPFVDPAQMPEPVARTNCEPEYDFFYVSDGAIHKNHPTLFRAWEILAQQGIFPSLALTLHPVRDAALRAVVDRLVGEKGVRIVDLGQMPHERLLGMYGRSRAFLFASYAESFGIPLIEASKAGLPILAAELDFVRDVCTPSVTFDPHSPRSIARAVRRFLGETSQSVDLLTPEAFVRRLLAHAEDGAPATVAVGAGE
jgi:glycosyltransferase involved in cell wall biosynthesis